MVTSYTLRYQIETPTAVALGLFDGVHKGHRAVIQKVVEQKSAGLTPCVFTFTVHGEKPASKKGYLEIMSGRRKSEIFAQLGIAIELCPDFDQFRDLTPREYVEKILVKGLQAKYVACGYDFRFGKGAAGDVGTLRQLCGEYGVEVCVVDHIDDGGCPVSSTRIRGLILDGEMEEANRLLESLFTVDTKVIHGRRLGRKLDFPTINQPFEKGHIIPRFGVYASIAYVDGAWRPGVTNVGIKPTVEVKDPLAETYILDFDGDLYGKSVEVALLSFLRPERKFDSIEQLKEQISQDSEAARRISGAYLKNRRIEERNLQKI